MIDSPMLFSAAPTAPLAHASAAVARKNGAGAGFAEVLAKSAASPDGPSQSDESTPQTKPIDAATAEDEPAQPIAASADIALDLAAMIAMTSAETPPAPPPSGNSLADSASDATQGVAGTSTVTAALVAGSLRGGATKAVIPTAPATPSDLPAVPALEEPAAISGKESALPATSAGTADAHQQTPSADVRIEPARDENVSPVATQAKSVPSTDTAALRQFDEAFKSQLEQAEAQATGIATAAPSHAGSVQSVASGDPPAISLVPTHAESPAWSKDFGQHLIKLAIEGQPAAEIHLNPPEWGPIHVSIELNGQEAILQFSAEQTQTRAALESAMPRLRELFAASNLNIADASISAESQSALASQSQGSAFSQQFSGARGDGSDQPQARNGGGRLNRAVAIDGAVAPMPSRRSAGRSRVDLFA
ncbi:MAG: flagellar hook-length control protein FliK [Usitatibacteraceae bacterium]